MTQFSLFPPQLWRRFRFLILLFLSSFWLTVGCENPGVNQASTLSIYNWSTYIDPEVISIFENEFEVKVQYDTFDSNDALLAKIQAGNPGYDIIVPTGDYVEIMIEEGLLEPLNLENIPNFKHIDAKFVDPPFDPGNQYSIPYQWGTMGLGYNITATGGEINSWSVIFDPKYRGKVAFIEDGRAMLSFVLMYLGYDPNSIDEAEINEAKTFMIEHKENIAAFAPDTGEALLNQGEVDLAIEWSGDIFQIMEENEEIRYVIPKEGSIVWTDTLAIPIDAPHPDLAEKFIDFVLRPEIGAKISNYTKYATPNKTAKDQGLIDAEDLNNPAIYPTSDVFERLEYVRAVGEANRLYDQAWSEIKLAVSQ